MGQISLERVYSKWRVRLVAPGSVDYDKKLQKQFYKITRDDARHRPIWKLIQCRLLAWCEIALADEQSKWFDQGEICDIFIG